MNRRDTVLALLLLGAAPLTSYAKQPTKVTRIGILSIAASSAKTNAEPFIQGMRELGYVEGENLVIEWRFADGHSERLLGLALELVQLKVDVIVTGGTPSIGAAQKATATIPIVMATSGDPVGSGFVKSLARPGTNITGLSIISADIGPKVLELLVTMVPKLVRVAYLTNPANEVSGVVLKNVQTAAQKVGINILAVKVRSVQEIEGAFAMVKKQNVGAVIVENDSLFINQRHLVANLAAKYRLPSISGFQDYVKAGGLMSYGPNVAESERHAAVYVVKILKGAKPSELPVEQPTRIELDINAKTAKALGLAIPRSLLLRADQVIE